MMSDKIDTKAIYEFKATITTERYYNNDSNFGVYTFSTKEKNIPNTEESEFNKGSYLGTLSGAMQELEVGMDYTIKSQLKYVPKYKNYVFCPNIIISEKPTSEIQQQKFLETLCTSNQSKALLSVYPNIIDDIMNNKKIDLNNVKGVKDKTFNKIKEKVVNNYIIQDILILLKPLGVSFKMIKKLIDFEENPALLKTRILDDPYILTRIHGLGFKKVDGIALKLNPQLRVSKKRVYAYLRYKLKEIGNSEGHTWIEKKILKGMIRKDINECLNEYNEVLKLEEDNPKLLYQEDDKVGLIEYYNLSQNIYDKIMGLDSMESMIEDFSEEEIEDAIAKSELEMGFSLTEEQKLPIRNINKHNVIIITAPAGAGKSTSIKPLITLLKNAKIKEKYLDEGYNQLHEEDKIDVFNEEGLSIGYDNNNSIIKIGQCALSAKAAKRMKETSGGMDAQTIHRALKWQGGQFEHNQSYPMNYHVNFIDEVSMVNDYILSSYLNAVKPNSKLILIFDFAQLPPIGMGDFTRDVLLSSDLCINKYTKVHRQGQKSGILMDANKVRVGENPIDKPQPRIVHGELNDMHYMFSTNKNKLQEVAINTYLTAIKNVGMDECVIISPRKKDCINSVNEINIKIQDILIDDSVPFIIRWKDGKEMKFKLGAKVMQKVNNYDKDKMVFNGDEGYLAKIDKDSFTITFNLENGKRDVIYSREEIDQIELSYAISVHSSQGSQYHTVISIFDMNSFILLNRKILYTAMTRAKNRHLLLAEPQAFKACIDDANNKPRNTFLSDIFRSNTTSETN